MNVKEKPTTLQKSKIIRAAVYIRFSTKEDATSHLPKVAVDYYAEYVASHHPDWHIYPNNGTFGTAANRVVLDLPSNTVKSACQSNRFTASGSHKSKIEK